jgi:hypothetical protein
MWIASFLNQGSSYSQDGMSCQGQLGAKAIEIIVIPSVPFFIGTGLARMYNPTHFEHVQQPPMDGIQVPALRAERG